MLAFGLVQRLFFLCAPWMRRYPHMKDSRMSTCLISTSTSYCWRSEVWLPLNRLPGRRSEEDVTGRNCVAISNHRLSHQSAHASYRITYSMGRKWRSEMAGDVSNGRWCSRGERRSLRGALVFGAVVCRRHGRGDVSVRFLYAGTRWLAVCLGRRLFAGAMWWWRGQSMCG